MDHHLLRGQLATIETPQDAEERLAASARADNVPPRIHHLEFVQKPMIFGYVRNVVDPPPVVGTITATFNDSALRAEVSNPTINDLLAAMFPFAVDKLTPIEILRRVGELCRSNRDLFWSELSREVEKGYGPTPGGYSREAWAAEHATDRNWYDAYDRVVGDDRP